MTDFPPMLWWILNEKTCQWEFRSVDGTRKVAAIAMEWIWEAREEPARAGLQNFLAKHKLDPLPDRAFIFEESSEVR